MGISIKCGKKSYSCGYGSWNRFRNEVILATIQYITQYNFNEQDDYESKIIDFVKDFEDRYNENKDMNFIDEFLSLCRDERLLDALIHYGLYGVYVLCNKMDDDGYYSVGNSYDICELLTNIRPLIQTRETLSNIEAVFQESIDTKKKVIIF
jgi:hypothetical protein